MIRTNVGDLSNFLIEKVVNSPFRNITLSGDGDTIKIHGTPHKIVPLPVEIVNGYTRMTPQAGLQIFMPDLDKLPHTKTNQNIGLDGLKIAMSPLHRISIQDNFIDRRHSRRRSHCPLRPKSQLPKRRASSTGRYNTICYKSFR